jgi:hypothetical protein
MHPAVAKAKQIARIAVQYGWQGNIDSEVIGNERITSLSATRNDEALTMSWINERLNRAGYSIFDQYTNISCAKHAIKKLIAWPDVIELIKMSRDKGANPVPLVETYRRLPFDWENDPDDEIIAAVKDHQIHWYSHLSGKVHSDVVLPKKKTEIKPVGHRKMLCFIGSQAGFRNVMLDTVLKVG